MELKLDSFRLTNVAHSLGLPFDGGDDEKGQDESQKRLSSLKRVSQRRKRGGDSDDEDEPKDLREKYDKDKVEPLMSMLGALTHIDAIIRCKVCCHSCNLV